MRCGLLSALSLLGLAGCDRAAAGPGAGELVIEWQGVERRGQVGLPAEVRLCREAGLVELLAVRGDTGVALALFPVDSGQLVAGDYPVFQAINVAEPRPGANVALRWFDRVTREAYEGLDGMIRLERVGEAVSGTFEARLRSVETSDSLRVEGRFERVPLATAPAGCAATLRRNRI